MQQLKIEEILYLEVPTPHTANVSTWLQQEWKLESGTKIVTPDGIRLQFSPDTSNRSQEIPENELSIFVWSVQRTTYLKVFRWGQQAIASEKKILQQLAIALKNRFPQQYPDLPAIDLSKNSIFAALAPHYPKTVHFFQKMPKGESDLQRVYWWEKRWRESVRHPEKPKQVVFEKAEGRRQGASFGRQGGQAGQGGQGEGRRQKTEIEYDLIYIGGALGAIHAAVMARLGYRVLLIERLPFGRMNREWNISRSELQCLLDLGLLTAEECESIIAREYVDGFNKFFDGNLSPRLKAAILHTPTVLNVALASDRWLSLCGDKLCQAGGQIWDETEFIRADIDSDRVTIQLVHLPTGESRQASGRLLIDAMGTASPIAWQLNGKRTFDSVCPTVGAVVEGIEANVWDSDYGDVLNSHGDISRGRQLIWELFPAEGDELTIYLFHYHQVHPDNPGSLLEMYEDFFTILPEYRRCDMEKLVWKKPTFGYIPGHFSMSDRDRTVAYNRLLAIGDAASLQSPLIFTGFGSLVRNLGRLTNLLDNALKNDLLSAADLNQIRAYQSNVSVTWLFSKGMMVPTGTMLPPQRINAMLNTFFGLLADEPPEVAETFIKDRIHWLMFTRLALKAAWKNPALLLWIVEMAGIRDMLRWLRSYSDFTLDAVKNKLLGAWFPNWLQRSQPWLEKRYPVLWLRWLSLRYSLRDRPSVNQKPG